MKWSFKLGRFLGIDVFVHATFLLIFALIGVANWLSHGSLTAVIGGLFFFAAIFLCVLLHEFGHSLMARHYGVATRDITLLPIGGVARLERLPDRPVQELWVALAGPAVNVVICLLLALWLSATGTWQPVDSLTATSGSMAERLLALNAFLVLFNLIPAYPMDGGRVLRACLAMRMRHARATRIAARLGQVLAVVFAVVGLLTNPLLVLIGLFIWFAAADEACSAEMKSTLGDLPVREAMLTNFRSLSPCDTLGEASRLLLNGSQQDFPVQTGGLLLGLLTRRRLFEALRERGEWAVVAEVMSMDIRVVHPDEPLERALSLLESEVATIPVVRDDRLEGLVTAENIGELMTLQTIQAHPVKTPAAIPRRRVFRPDHVT